MEYGLQSYGPACLQPHHLSTSLSSKDTAFSNAVSQMHQSLPLFIFKSQFRCHFFTQAIPSSSIFGSVPVNQTPIFYTLLFIACVVSITYCLFCFLECKLCEGSACSLHCCICSGWHMAGTQN